MDYIDFVGKPTTGLNYVPKFEPSKRLRGGWFCGPDEFKSMGFTLGLPPCVYLPESKEVEELSEKLRPLNGMALPSYYLENNNNKKATKADRCIVVISEVPSSIEEEDIISVLIQIMSKKFPPEINPVISVEIIRSAFFAYVTLAAPEIADFLVKLKSLQLDNKVLPISFPEFTLNSVEKIDADYAMIEFGVIVENPNNEDIPDNESILNTFEKFAHIIHMYRPLGFNHVILNVANLKDEDSIILNCSENVTIQNINVRVKRFRRDVDEANQLIDQRMKKNIYIQKGNDSKYIPVLSPFMHNNPSIADIFDPSMTINALVIPETEKLQPPSGSTLLIFNIIPISALQDVNEMFSYSEDIKEECKKYGKVANVKIEQFFRKSLPSDYAVAKVEFSNPTEAKYAQLGISGRRFCGRIVITQICMDEEKTD